MNYGYGKIKMRNKGKAEMREWLDPRPKKKDASDNIACWRERGLNGIDRTGDRMRRQANKIGWDGIGWRWRCVDRGAEVDCRVGAVCGCHDCARRGRREKSEETKTTRLIMYLGASCSASFGPPKSSQIVIR